MLFAVKRILGSVEILLGLGQVGRGFHALVRKGCLLRAIQLGLGSLEILSDLCLASGKRLLIAQQAKLIFPLHVAYANLILVVGVSVLFAALLLFARKIHKTVGYAFVAAYVAYTIGVYALFMSDIHIPVGG